MGKPARSKSLGAAGAEDVYGAAPVPAQAAGRLHKAFEGLGLTPYQARVQLALLQAGPANCLDLARLAGIPRTSIYQILDELGAMGVAARLPGSGPAVWASPERSEVLSRLVALEEERLSQLKERSTRLGEMLDEVLPEGGGTRVPYVHVIHDPSRVRPLYEQLLGQASEELLVFNRPPYAARVGPPQPVIVQTIERIGARVLYQASETEGPEHDAWHREMAVYAEAGAEGRVVDELPIKLALFDRRTALLSLDDPTLPQVGFPITLLIDHPGYAEVQARAFESLWAEATPYAPAASRSRRRRKASSA